MITISAPILVSIAVSLVILALYFWSTNIEHLELRVPISLSEQLRDLSRLLYLQHQKQNRDQPAIDSLMAKIHKIKEQQYQQCLESSNEQHCRWKHLRPFSNRRWSF